MILATLLEGVESTGAQTPCLPDGADRALLHRLWNDLLVRLAHTARESAQPDAVRRFKALGIRRPTTVSTSLAREYARSHALAAAAGFVLPHEDILRTVRELPFGADIDDDFDMLARDYGQLLREAQPPSGSLLFRWLRARAHVHAAQAEAIRRGI